MSTNVQPYAQNGVFVSKSSINAGDKVTLSYSGLLADSGADVIYAHIGYGETWEEKDFIEMQSENGVFSITFKVALPGILNVSFKDSANNWDNNSSNNYSFKVSKKASGVAKTGVKTETDTKKADPKTAVVKKSTAKKTETVKPAAKTKTVAKKK